jgi:hypothetical protein
VEGALASLQTDIFMVALGCLLSPPASRSDGMLIAHTDLSSAQLPIAWYPATPSNRQSPLPQLK